VLHCRQKKEGAKERGAESRSQTQLQTKDILGGQRNWGLGGAAREAQEESRFCFQKPVISFPSWWTRPEGFWYNGNRSCGHEGVSALHSWKLPVCPV